VIFDSLILEVMEMGEDCCIFPRCPKCGKGYLLPFSYKEDVFEKWKCSECGHTIQKKE